MDGWIQPFIPWIPYGIFSGEFPAIFEVFIVPHEFLRTPRTQYWLMY